MTEDSLEILESLLRRRLVLPTSRPWIKWIGVPPPGELSSRFEDVLARTQSTACPVIWAGARCLPDGTHEFHLNIFEPTQWFCDLSAREAEWVARVSEEPVVKARDHQELLEALEQRYAPVSLPPAKLLSLLSQEREH